MAPTPQYFHGGLGVSGAPTASKLELKVTYANDLHDLWYLRGDVMAALVNGDGRANGGEGAPKPA
jgi:hypothetical protein